MTANALLGPVVLHVIRLERDYFDALEDCWEFALQDDDEDKQNVATLQITDKREQIAMNLLPDLLHESQHPRQTRPASPCTSNPAWAPPKVAGPGKPRYTAPILRRPRHRHYYSKAFPTIPGYYPARFATLFAPSSRCSKLPTITTRRRKDGTTAYRAEVRIMRDGAQVFKAVRTFDSKPQARAWAAALEAEWQARAAAPERPMHTVATVIGRYLARMDELKTVGRTRRAVLSAICRTDLGALVAADLTVADLVGYAEQRRAAGAGPATVLIDYASLRTVFSEARPLLNLAVDETVFRAARPLLVKLGLIAPPAKRKRRPQSDELERLLAHFRKRSQHVGSLLPMADIVEFAIYTCLRQGEICRVLWADLDESRRTMIVRDRKAPQGKAGNDQEIPLLGPALAIAQRQPRDAARIFPYDARSVSAAFTRVCAQLGIADLHFHDLRREGASRLLEMGYTVPEVATVTGHKDLNILWRVYSNITPEHLHGKYKEKAP